jgi:hypothetical protein
MKKPSVKNRGFPGIYRDEDTSQSITCANEIYFRDKIVELIWKEIKNTMPRMHEYYPVYNRLITIS